MGSIALDLVLKTGAYLLSCAVDEPASPQPPPILEGNNKVSVDGFDLDEKCIADNSGERLPHHILIRKKWELIRAKAEQEESWLNHSFYYFFPDSDSYAHLDAKVASRFTERARRWTASNPSGNADFAALENELLREAPEYLAMFREFAAYARSQGASNAYLVFHETPRTEDENFPAEPQLVSDDFAAAYRSFSLGGGKKKLDRFLERAWLILAKGQIAELYQQGNFKAACTLLESLEKQGALTLGLAKVFFEAALRTEDFTALRPFVDSLRLRQLHLLNEPVVSQIVGAMISLGQFNLIHPFLDDLKLRKEFNIDHVKKYRLFVIHREIDFYRQNGDIPTAKAKVRYYQDILRSEYKNYYSNPNRHKLSEGNIKEDDDWISRELGMNLPAK